MSLPWEDTNAKYPRKVLFSEFLNVTFLYMHHIQPTFAPLCAVPPIASQCSQQHPGYILPCSEKISAQQYPLIPGPQYVCHKHTCQFTSENCAHLPRLSQGALSSSEPSGTKQHSVACFCELCLQEPSIQASGTVQTMSNTPVSETGEVPRRNLDGAEGSRTWG